MDNIKNKENKHLLFYLITFNTKINTTNCWAHHNEIWSSLFSAVIS